MLRSMKLSCRRRYFVLILTLFVGLGMTVSAVQASIMPVKVTVTTSDDITGGDDCDGCIGNDGNEVTSICMPGCGNGCYAVPPAKMDVCTDQSSQTVASLKAKPSEIFLIPDLSPPRSAFLI